jgi:flagellar motor switch protein FliG
MPHLEADELEDILNGFYQLCLTQKVITDGGIEYARNVLEKTYGAKTAAALLEKVTKSIRTKAFDFIRKTDSKNLVAAIQNEHPQTIALILAYSRAELAAAVIGELPKDKKIEVVERIAKMDKASPDVIRLVEKNLETKFSSFMSMDFTEVGGINYTADIMNNMDRTNEKYIFDEISKRDAKLADDIRKKMFVFEDIVLLDSMSIQRFCAMSKQKISCMP